VFFGFIIFYSISKLLEVREKDPETDTSDVQSVIFLITVFTLFIFIFFGHII